MPRTSLDNRKHEPLLILIHGAADVRGKYDDDLGKMIGKSAKTLRARMKDPGTLTYDEMTKLCRGLCIPIEELRRCIRY